MPADEQPTSHTETVKSGKFSKMESDLVLNTMKEYALENNINFQDICPHYRDTDTKSNHRELWRKLELLLPHRRKVSIYQHAMRLIYSSNQKNQRNKAFSEEETRQLLKLVEVHGNNFSLIGRHLNKRPDDCKQYLIRMKRKKVGSFTLDEDKKIVACVRELLKIPINAELPHTDIPWTNVAKLLNNERIPLDYLRRYNTILRLNKRYRYPDDENSFNILCKNNGSNANIDGDVEGDHSDHHFGSGLHLHDSQVSHHGVDSINNEASKSTRVVRTPHCRTEELLDVKIKLLHWLKEKNFSHESEVVWVEADRSLAINVSRQHWLSMSRILNNNPNLLTNELKEGDYSTNRSLIDEGANISNKSFKEQLNFLISYLETRRIEQSNPINFRKSRTKSIPTGREGLPQTNLISTKHEEGFDMLHSADEDEDDDEEEDDDLSHMNFSNQQELLLPNNIMNSLLSSNMNSEYPNQDYQRKRRITDHDQEAEEPPVPDLDEDLLDESQMYLKRNEKKRRREK